MGSSSQHKKLVVQELEPAQVRTSDVTESAVGPVPAVIVPGMAFGEFGLRPKLEVGRSEDPAEREADHLADTVVAALHRGARVSEQPRGSQVQRQTAASANAPEVGAAGGALSPAMQSAITSARRGGDTLPDPVRRDMEGALNADLSAVRVHTGPAVAEIASGISARAFTVGNDVYFPRGLPDTASPTGTHLLAHELAHVVQQHAGRRAEPANPVQRSVIRRNEDSAILLTELAQPKVFEGPEVKLQNEMVQKLEAATPVLTKRTDEARKKARDELDEWDSKFKAAKHTQEESDEHVKEWTRRNLDIGRRFPAFSSQELYLGSVVLTGIPATPEGDEKLIESAKLVETDNAFKAGQNGFELSRFAGVEKDIVRNTLQTMIHAKQIDYLRKSGFVGKGWKIIVEVHYIRNRPSSAANFHKDTLGQTLFVNLNFTNKDEMAGPEYVVNPPLAQSHEQHINDNLPADFMTDLGAARKAHGTPKEIKRAGSKDSPGTLKPNSVVAFVDEAIHHSTPLVGHRDIRIEKLKTFLQNEAPFSDLYDEAEAAYKKFVKKNNAKPGFLSSIFGSKKPNPDDGPAHPFSEFFKARVTKQEMGVWEALMELCAQPDNTTVNRPVLLDAGLTNDQIDLALSEYGPDTFNAVSIPPQARTDPTATGRIPMKDKESGRRPVLKREMSYAALDQRLPPVAVKNDNAEGPKRTFFRTWIRAVKAAD